MGATTAVADTRGWVRHGVIVLANAAIMAECTSGGTGYQRGAHSNWIDRLWPRGTDIATGHIVRSRGFGEIRPYRSDGCLRTHRPHGAAFISCRARECPCSKCTSYHDIPYSETPRLASSQQGRRNPT